MNLYIHKYNENVIELNSEGKSEQAKKLRSLAVFSSLRVWKVGGSNPRSGQVKDLKIGTCCFPG